MDTFEDLWFYTGQSASGLGAALAFGDSELLLQALCASPVAADQSPSCPSSNQSSASDVHMSGSGPSGLSLVQHVQQLVEPGKGSFAPFAGYQAAKQQQVPLFDTLGLRAAPGISSFANLGAGNMLPQQPQHQYHASAAMQYPAAHASSAQHPAAAALAEPLCSSNQDAALRNFSSAEQQQLLEMLLNAQHQQHVVPQPNDMPRQSFQQPYPQQQPQQHSFVSSPLVQAHELQQLQVLLQPKAEPNCFTFSPQLQQMEAPPRQRQVQTAQEVLAAADAAAAARRSANRGPAAKAAGTKRPAAKEPKQPKQAAKARAPASSEDEAPEPAAPKKRGRPPLNPGKYSRGYLAIKAYRQRKKGMVSDGFDSLYPMHDALTCYWSYLTSSRAALW
jgi:hypothetical protein